MAITHIWHGRNQSSHHDIMAHPLHLIKWEHIPQSHQNGRTLISDHVRRHPTIILEWPLDPDWVFLVTDEVPPFKEWQSSPISDHVGTNPTVTSEWISTHIWHGRNQSSYHDIMASPLHLTMEGTNPLTMSEWLMNSSLPLGGNLDLENTKILPEVLKLYSG